MSSTPDSLPSDDLLLIRSLLAEKPSPLRPETLLEAIDMERVELPQSRLLAWLLSPRGPIEDHRLLKTILSRMAPTQPWPGSPRHVTAEMVVGSDRPDIVAEWDSFKLIVEYKIDSPEGSDQVRRYLEALKITSPSEGLAVFVSPSGIWPRSIKRDGVLDPMVRKMSFEDLIDCINSLLNESRELSERGRIMVAEYRDCLKRNLKRSIYKEKPVISEATKLLCKYNNRIEKLSSAAHGEAAVVLRENHDHIEKLKESAYRETEDFLIYVTDMAEIEMRKILGPDMKTTHARWESSGYRIFRKPQWETTDIEYGFVYGPDLKPGERLLPDYRHRVAVRVRPHNSYRPAKGQLEFTLTLRGMIDELHDIGPTNSWFAYWRKEPCRPDQDWDEWAKQVIDDLCQDARRLTPILDRFAASHTTAERPRDVVES